MNRSSRPGTRIRQSLKKAAAAAASVSMAAGLAAPLALTAPAALYAQEAAVFAGKGTEQEPYRIQSVQDLSDLGRLSNSDASYASAHYVLEEDLDCKDTVIASIGRTHHFSGVFDGQGHRIFNLKITEGDQTGLFSFLDGGTIRNLGLENAQVSGGANTGLLIGRTMHANVLNCYAAGTASGSHDVGTLIGMTNNTLVYNCFGLGTVRSTGVSAGGLLGSINRSIDPSTDAAVINCYAFASVEGTNHVGSVIGYDESGNPAHFVTMENVFGKEGLAAVGNNPGREGTALMAETAMKDGTLTDRLNDGLQEGFESWAAREDGLPGFFEDRHACGLYGKGTATNPWRITDGSDLALAASLTNEDASFADDYFKLSKDIDMTGITMTPIGKTNHFTGTFDGGNHTISNLIIEESSALCGLFGFAENCVIKNVGIESGRISGTSHAGGIAGRTMRAQILNCYNKADVSGTADVGGLAGMLNNTKIRNCFASGSVLGTDRSIGGIAGSANRSLDPETPVTIENSYSAAEVSGPLYAGSVIGYDEQGDGYEVGLIDVYARTGTTPSPRVDRPEVTLLDSSAMKDGTLIKALNASLQEGDLEWMEETSGMPGFHGKVYISTTLSGEGSEESPYLISQAEDLTEMNRIVSLSKEKAEAYYALANSVDLKGSQEFAGIEGRFSGHFDGRGFAIRNLAIRTLQKTNTGLFHILDGAVVENVNLESGEIYGSRTTGGIGGLVVDSQIRNCMISAKVRGYDVAGGLAGELRSSVIENCASNGKVQCPTNNGGFAGVISQPADDKEASRIVNSYVMGHPFWGTNNGKVAGNVTSGAVVFENVTYSSQYKPNVAIGSTFEAEPEGISMKTRSEMESQAFVDALNASSKEQDLHWILGSDGKPRLDLFEQAAALDAFIFSIKDQPAVQDGKLVLPVSEDGKYQAVLAGSDNRATVALDGSVYTPLRDQKVLLIYDIADVQTGEIKGRVDRNIVLDVRGTWQDEGAQSAPMVIPGLREWHGEEGSLKLKKGAAIAASSEAEKAAAGRILEYLNEICPFELTITDKARPGDLVLHLDPERENELQSEGYAMTVSDRIEITAAEEQGLLYGGISIAQILYQDAVHVTVPRGEVRDYPADELRGGMFDVARRYFDLDYMEEIGKYMAWFKMNTLHLHLNETGGEYPSSFVLESEKYPAINENNKGYVWSKNDYRQMQKDLNAYGVKVISEIDTPGHSGVFAKIAPELVSGADLRLGDHYEECLALIESIFDEYLDGDDPVFQNAIVNIGTDESGNTKENMRRYINDLAQYCLSKDNVDKVEFWGNLSLYYGDTEVKPENVIERIWDGPDQRVDDALENGYYVTNSTSNMMYIVPGRGLGFFSGYLEVDKFYETWKGSSDFCTGRLPNPYWIGGKNYYSDYTLLKGDSKILGSFFCDWNDAGWGNDYDIFEIMKPYMGAMGEKGWYGEEMRFESGQAFKEAYEAIGKTGIAGNPGRQYEDKDRTLASFDFGKLSNGIVSGGVLDRKAEVSGSDMVSVPYGDETIQALSLNESTNIRLPFDGIGYPYTAAAELYLDGTQSQDAILFQDDQGVFYANYKGNGPAYRMGKYTYSFNCTLPENEWFTMAITSSYVPGGSASTVLKINGRDYSASQIEKTATNANGVPSSYLPTQTVFANMKGFLKSLTIRNSWNLMPNVDYTFKRQGTAANPYRIENASDLQRFLDYCGSSVTKDVHFSLYADLDLAGRTISPAADFKGVFDGNGHCISNMTINRGDQGDIGLFCQLNGGTIRNLRFKNASVAGGRHTGVVAGRTGSGALLENIRVDGTVSAVADGGLIIGMFNNGTMRNCGSTGSVTVSVESVGGLTGSANLSPDPSSPISYENCWSAASVSGRYAGRITGWDESVSEDLPVGMTNVYYLEGNNPSGNYARTDGAVSFAQSALGDGSLLDLLNEGLKEGMSAWITGQDGLPDFAAVPEPAATSKVLLEMAVARAEQLKAEGALEMVNALAAANFETALARGQEILADADASQFTVNEAWNALCQAIQMLSFTSDFTELDALIARAQAIDLSGYEEEGQEYFLEALENALEVRQSQTALTEVSIADACSMLEDAMEALIRKDAGQIDLSLLQMVVDACSGIDLSQYVEEGQDIFLQAEEEALQILQNPENQKQVDDAAVSLNTAWLNLRLKPSESLLKALQNFVDQVSRLDLCAYAPATWNTISMLCQETARALENPNTDARTAEALAVRIAAVQEMINHPDGTDSPQKTVKADTAPDTAKSVKTGVFAGIPAAAGTALLGLWLGKRRNRKK